MMVMLTGTVLIAPARANSTRLVMRLSTWRHLACGNRPAACHAFGVLPGSGLPDPRRARRARIASSSCLRSDFEVLLVSRQRPPPGDGRVGVEEDACGTRSVRGTARMAPTGPRMTAQNSTEANVSVSLRATALPTYLGWMMDWMTLLIPP